MKLSVITPVFNQEKLILTGLNSVPKRDDIEHIVIDDCSTDDTYNVVLNYKKETGKKIILLHNDRNRGIGYSVNRGLDIAKGEYIGQLDADGDYYVNLESAFQFFGWHDLIYYSLRVNNGDFWILKEGNPGKYCGTVKFMRREFIGNLRERHLENCEDVYFYEELMKKHPTEFFIDRNIMFLHYNYPREHSLTWNVLNGITPRAMERE